MVFAPQGSDDAQPNNTFWTAVNEGLAYVGRMFDKSTGVPLAVGEGAAVGAYGMLTVYEANLRADYNYYASLGGMRPVEDYTDQKYLNMRKKVDWKYLTGKYGERGFDKAKHEMYQQLLN